MIHDSAKWGDCLSGALTIQDYWGGLREAGFKGVTPGYRDSLESYRWDSFRFRDADGFIKQPVASSSPSTAFATLTGPFSQAQDELGTTFHRGAPQEIDEQTVNLLSLPSYKEHFVVTDRPIALTNQDPQLSRCNYLRKVLVFGKVTLLFTPAPFLAVSDDDHHIVPMRGTTGNLFEKHSKSYNILDINLHSESSTEPKKPPLPNP